MVSPQQHGFPNSPNNKRGQNDPFYIEGLFEQPSDYPAMQTAQAKGNMYSVIDKIMKKYSTKDTSDIVDFTYNQVWKIGNTLRKVPVQKFGRLSNDSNKRFKMEPSESSPEKFKEDLGQSMIVDDGWDPDLIAGEDEDSEWKEFDQNNMIDFDLVAGKGFVAKVEEDDDDSDNDSLETDEEEEMQMENPVNNEMGYRGLEGQCFEDPKLCTKSVCFSCAANLLDTLNLTELGAWIPSRPCWDI